MQTVLRIFHLKADKMRQLYQQLRNKYQMHCAYAQGNAKMREAYNKWRDPRRRQWSNTGPVKIYAQKDLQARLSEVSRQ